MSLEKSMEELKAAVDALTAAIHAGMPDTGAVREPTIKPEAEKPKASTDKPKAKEGPAPVQEPKEEAVTREMMNDKIVQLAKMGDLDEETGRKTGHAKAASILSGVGAKKGIEIKDGDIPAVYAALTAAIEEGV